mgnify:CR=1 FL=1
MNALLDAFIAHRERLDRGGLPQSVADSVRTFVIDSLAVGIAGAAAPLTATIRRTARQWGKAGPSPLFGPASGSLDPCSAAFVNGFQIHCQEFDCVHEAAVVHPMATVFAALTADCAARDAPVDGDRFAKAVALAVDVAVTLGVAARSPIRFFRPANAGLFGAVMGLSFIRRLTDDQIRDAMGYALSFNAGTMQPHVEGKPALPVQIGHAARSAIMATDLAEAGMPGAHDSLEGPYGYFALFETQTDLSDLASSLGECWRIAEVSHKPFPTGRAAHGGIALMQELRANGVGPDDVLSIDLEAPPLIQRLVGREVTAGMSANYARLCFPYVGAVALMRGDVALHDFTETALTDPEIMAIGKRITVTESEVADPAAFVPQVLRAELVNGEVREIRISNLHGTPNNPLANAAQRRKVEDCIAFAYGRPEPGLAQELWAMSASLETLHDINQLTRIAGGACP